MIGGWGVVGRVFMREGVLIRKTNTVIFIGKIW